MPETQGIKTENLTIGYGSDLIKEICIEAVPGKVVTLIGPNGSGKTTLLRTLTGELESRGGVIYLNGKDKSLLNSYDTAKAMSMVMTEKIRTELMTVREVVEVGRYPYTGKLGILSEEDNDKVRDAMEQTDTSLLAEKYFNELSDGQKQRVLLAKAICQEPDVLILDEPTSYLDIKYKIDLLGKIRRFASEKNIAVLMSLHELDIARKVSDVVVAVGDGKVLKIGTPAEVCTERFIRKLYNIEGVESELLGEQYWESASKDSDCEKSLERNEEEGHSDASFEILNKHQRKNVSDNSTSEKSGEITSHHRAKVIMIQGTMSNAGKSLVAAGLCRIFADDGYKVAPFKSQNMALNSYITDEGLEMGRAQVVQAECARIRPVAEMNPILLKPTSAMGSQVVVNGKVVGNMKAMDYFRHKKDYIPEIMKAYEKLSDMADIIVVEGAGSPVELNLKDGDIVNMGLAEMIDSPVLLVGDIDRGGIFPQLLGTLDLLTAKERERVKGLIVNKFRGDGKLFESGINILEDKGRTKVVGVVPYMDIKIDDEDSLSERFTNKTVGEFDIAVIKLRMISNSTDLDTFDQIREASVRYVEKPSELGDPDLLIIPGSKNTIEDLRELIKNGLFDAIIKKAKEGTVVIGICGGYQILGESVEDPECAESGGSETGLGLLPVKTVMGSEKIRTVYSGNVISSTGILESLKGAPVTGYEIHMGETHPTEELTEFTSGKTGYCKGNVYGTYIHGFFDKKEILEGIVRSVSESRGKKIDTASVEDYKDRKEVAYDKLAENLRKSLDMEYIYKVLGLNK
ncbi:MAG: cobyric acid synthase [Lachnospiraceae bacterium]|nr:cobyric acid synthase [Lachnospiraceae bacterium]